MTVQIGDDGTHWSPKDRSRRSSSAHILTMTRRCQKGTIPFLLIVAVISRIVHIQVVDAWNFHPTTYSSITTSSPTSSSRHVRSRAMFTSPGTKRKSTSSLCSFVNCDATTTNSTEDYVGTKKIRAIRTSTATAPCTDYETYQNQKLDLQLLLLDNYDSYTYNIYSYLSTICKNPPIVVSNDAYDSWQQLIDATGEVDGIIISPGPGRPERKEDMGVCLEAIEMNPDLPILGVCLGHQALGYHYKAKIQLAPHGAVHGLSSAVTHKQTYNGREITDDDDEEEERIRLDLFSGISQAFDVVRYHSLVVQFPPEDDKENKLTIEPIAWCMSDTEAETGYGEICMALQHKENPHYGVQFHPESVGTGENGYKIFKNFSEFCVNRRREITLRNGHMLNRERLLGLHTMDESQGETNEVKKTSAHEVYVHKISNADAALPSPVEVFENLFASMDDSYWLDSSTGRKDADIEELRKPSAFGRNDGCPIVSNSRFSIMGGNLGPLCDKVEYWGKDHKIENRGLFVTKSGAGVKERIKSEQDLITYLRNEVSRNGIVDTATLIKFDDAIFNSGHTMSRIESLPFDFRGGFVGYLGYEMWHDTRDEICSYEHCGVGVDDKETDCSSNPQVPTAAFLFADRSLVYDHWREEWYLIGVIESSSSTDDIVQWMKETSGKVHSLAKVEETPSNKESQQRTADELEFHLKRSREEYSSDIDSCHDKIKNGESYELCLTNQLSAQVTFQEESSDSLSSTPFGLYKILREKNPAPFAAFMKFDGDNSNRSNELKEATPHNIDSSVTICCSSPERFLSVKKEQSASFLPGDAAIDHGWEFAPPFVSKTSDQSSTFIVESKPIKGTASRIIANKDDPDFDEKLEADKAVAEELRRSGKNRAENLMIVDLLRNDLSRICEPGSVYVPKLMGIESFATVHQMVSTIRGNVDPKYTPIDVIAACFPGGSMTGAPKLRSVDILDQLELGNSRGPYSGSLGYISLNGSMDMNIVIRTAVVTPNCTEYDDADNHKSWDVEIGAGGAITALSDSEDEFLEMLLKASAIRKSVQQWQSDGN